MGTKRTDAHAGGTRAHVAVHDLACFVEHLHFFLGVVVGRHFVNLRNDVVSQLVRELVDGLHSSFFDEFLVLLLQFLHGSGPGSACTLIARDVDFPNMAEPFNRFHHDNHHNCGAIGVGYDASGAVQGVFGIHFGHHQRHVVAHAEGT